MNAESPFFARTRSFLYGIKLPLAATRLLIRERALTWISIFPVVLTLVLYFVAIRWIDTSVRKILSDYFALWGFSPESWLAWILHLITQILLLIVGALTFTFASTLLAAPLNDFLAEKTEKFAIPPLPPVPHSSFLRQVGLVGMDLLKTLAATGATLLALVFSWIPVLNLMAFILMFLLVCFQFVTYPQTRRGVGIRGGLGFLWRHFYACLGFGVTTSFLLSIPLLACFALPIAVIGGTLLVARAPGGTGFTPLK